MSFLDRIIKKSATDDTLAPHESFVAILIAIAAIDGNIVDEEVTDFMSTFNKSKLLSTLSKEQFSHLVNKVINIKDKKGANVLLEMGMDCLPANIYKATYINACDLIYSDGEIKKEELNAIILLRDRLKIDEVEAAQIAEFIQLKNSL